MTDLSLRLAGYRLTTAEILYRLPDFPDVLQTYVWQNLDLAPKFPVLQRFLEFWQTSIDGKLFSVRIASSQIFAPEELRHVGVEWRLQ
jgi:uncharacterized protein Usg